MAEPQGHMPCWASLSGPLVVVFRYLGSQDLVSCSTVCKSWRHCIMGATDAWAAALEAEFGYATQSTAERQSARQLLIAARTSRLFLSGHNFLGATCSKSSRFTAPEQLVLRSTAADAAQGEPGASNGGIGPAANSLPPPAVSLSVAVHHQTIGGLGAGTIGIKSVAAGADFAVLLTWDGRVLDTRCLTASGSGSQQPRSSLDWRGLWRPPCCRAVQIAAGGCWQGSGRPGGHVLVVTGRHTVWAWGGNSAGQLGLQASGSSNPTSAAAASSASITSSTTGWLPAPSEVVDSAAAGWLGLPTAVAAGDEHSVLLCRSGEVYAAGSNAAGACGLPVVQLQAAAFSLVPLPLGELAAAVSCGGRNTAVLTARRRLLVCGANDFGQAGVGRQGGSVFLLTDVGPSAAWHGMQRANQLSRGGGGEAAAGVVDVECGSGSLYALSDQGEVFSWGQGGQGELALGGCTKNICTPSRMPWTQGIACLAASRGGGRFGAVVDTHARLFTFGAGKSGALGHGDTNKRAVGRQVKALQGHAVHAVACGSDWMLVVAGWKAPTAGRAGKASSAKPVAAAPPAAAAAEGSTSPLADQAAPGSPPCGFRYKEVEPDPPPLSPRSPRHRRSHIGGSSSGGAQLLPGSEPSTPRPSHSGSSAAGSVGSSRNSGVVDEAAGEHGRLRARSGREQHQGEQQGQRNGHGRGSGWGPELPDTAPEAAVSRRRRGMQEPPAAPSSFSDPGSDCDSGPEGSRCSRHRDGGSSSGGSSPRMDREMGYLLRRQLKAFSNDPCQREIFFPRSFSAKDRWKVHIMAESWGLMHESYGDGARRRLVVWKPSRSRKSLKPALLAGMATGSTDSDSDGGSKRGGDSPGAAAARAPNGDAQESLADAANTAGAAAAAAPASEAASLAC